MTEDEEMPRRIPLPPVKYGETWKLGVHTFICGDAEQDDDVNKLMSGYEPDVVYCDPPWNPGISTQFRRNADRVQPGIISPHQVNFRFLMQRLAICWSRCKGSVFVEMSAAGTNQQVLDETISGLGGRWLKQWNIMYGGGKRPALLTRYSWSGVQDFPDAADLTGRDDSVTPRLVLAQYPAGRKVLDTNTGLGGTPMAAEEFGHEFRGLEIHSGRMARAIRHCNYMETLADQSPERVTSG